MPTTPVSFGLDHNPEILFRISADFSMAADVSSSGHLFGDRFGDKTAPVSEGSYSPTRTGIKPSQKGVFPLAAGI
jgi:hypothetical protein